MKQLRVIRLVWATIGTIAGMTANVGATGGTPEHPDLKPHNKFDPLASPTPAVPFIVPQQGPAPIPKEERTFAVVNAGFSTPSAFSSTSTTPLPASQTLSGPVTLTYNGSANALSLTQGGTGRGLSASITDANNGLSTLYGDTTGSGAGLTGYNLGTLGPGGKFQVTDAESAQAGAFASTNGTGPGLLGTITNTTSSYPAIFGQSIASSNGAGVEGEGNAIGVYGLVPSSSSAKNLTGVYGESDVKTANPLTNFAVQGYSAKGNGIGVAGVASSGYGVYAVSSQNYGLYALSEGDSGAIYAKSTGLETVAIDAVSESGTGVQGTAMAPDQYGVEGFGSNGVGVYGYDESGNGVVGYTYSGIAVSGLSGGSGLAGYFEGDVNVTGILSGNVRYPSDKNLKTDVHHIDGKDLLARVSQLPITSWVYKNDLKNRHVGPMAQDFHAAFGLNGADATHISLVDIAGVSLAAIQQLNAELKARDAEIAELKAQTAAQAKVVAKLQQDFSVRMTALEHQQRGTATPTVAVASRSRQMATVD
jgi:hypothetical protein